MYIYICKCNIHRIFYGSIYICIMYIYIYGASKLRYCIRNLQELLMIQWKMAQLLQRKRSSWMEPIFHWKLLSLWKSTTIFYLLDDEKPGTPFVSYFFGNFTPKTSNYCLKNRALGFPGTWKMLKLVNQSTKYVASGWLSFNPWMKNMRLSHWIIFPTRLAPTIVINRVVTPINRNGRK